MRDAIAEIKTGEGFGTEFGKAGTVFIVTKVGNSDDATVFLNELAEDEEVGSMVYTHNKPLDISQAISEQPGQEGYAPFVSRFVDASLYL